MAEEPDLAIMRIPRAGMFILAVFSGNDQKVCYQAQKMHAYITFIVITFALDKILYFCLLKQIDRAHSHRRQIAAVCVYARHAEALAWVSSAGEGDRGKIVYGTKTMVTAPPSGKYVYYFYYSRNNSRSVIHHSDRQPNHHKTMKINAFSILFCVF